MAWRLGTEMEILDSMFEQIWQSRPLDVEYGVTEVKAQDTMVYLREQTGMTVNYMASRLGVLPSKLVSMETRGTLKPPHLERLRELALEYNLEHMAHLFERHISRYYHPTVMGDKVRGRRKVEEL